VTIAVAIADDQALVRAGFGGIIAATPGMTVVGEAANGIEAVALAQRAHPDVMLMDVRMPELDGIEATRRITASPQTASVRVIILTTFDLDEYVFAALRAGASGFLLKDTIPADLIGAIGVVAAGEALLAPSVTRRLIAAFSRLPAAAPASALAESRRRPDVTRLLTDREREVLTLIATGLSNAEIAGRLYISPATAKTHVAHLLAKLNARDRVQLVIIAYQAGLSAPRLLVAEVAPVVLEDEGDRGEHQRHDADDEQPPADREAHGGDRGGQPDPQRPPGVRAEEAYLASALGDLALVVVFGAQRQPPPGEQHVEPGEQAQPDRQGQRRRPGRVKRHVPVDDVGPHQEDPAAEEEPSFDLHG